MALSLPYDIWCMIARFIPKSTLMQLYGVNSAFFDLVMNEQYREVTIYHIKHENTRRCVLNMSPTVVKRVRSLTLRPHPFGNDQPKLSNKGHQAVVGKIRKYFRKTREGDKDSESKHLNIMAAAQTLCRHIADMTEVTSLTIGCYPCDNFQQFNSTTSFVSAAWSAHGSRLRRLSLNIPLEAYPDILSSAPAIEALEELALTLHVAYATTLYEGTLITIAAFVQRHTKSLKSLAIKVPGGHVDPFNLLSNLQHLPLLTKLSLRLWLDRLKSQYPTRIDSFVTQHASTITELKLRFTGPLLQAPFPSPEEFFSHPIFKVRLPALTSLDLGLCHWPKEVNSSVKENLVEYIRPMSKSLSTLLLRDYVLTFPELEGIIGVFNGSNSRLRRLEMHVYFLSCDFFDLLHKHLPQLHTLEVRFDSLISRDDGLWNANYYWNGYDTRAAEFVQDMADRNYSEWSLRHLMVRPLYYCSGRWDECRKLLAAALPSVITFNGVSGEEFADIPDYTKP